MLHFFTSSSRLHHASIPFTYTMYIHPELLCRLIIKRVFHLLHKQSPKGVLDSCDVSNVYANDSLWRLATLSHVREYFSNSRPIPHSTTGYSFPPFEWNKGSGLIWSQSGPFHLYCFETLALPRLELGLFSLLLLSFVSQLAMVGTVVHCVWYG